MDPRLQMEGSNKFSPVRTPVRLSLPVCVDNRLFSELSRRIFITLGMKLGKYKWKKVKETEFSVKLRVGKSISEPYLIVLRPTTLMEEEGGNSIGKVDTDVPHPPHYGVTMNPCPGYGPPIFSLASFPGLWLVVKCRILKDFWFLETRAKMARILRLFS